MQSSHDDAPLIITIGRQMGCGGRELGRLLASRLGIGYYDKELLIDVARQAGMPPEYLASKDERTPSFLSGVMSFTFGHSPINFYATPSAISDDNLYAIQSDYIRELGRKESCVIVGRTSDYILRDHPRCVNVFLHASDEDCARRIMERGDVKTHQEAKALAARTNKIRAAYYNFFTDRRWGNAATYDLCINTSLMSMEQVADVVLFYIKQRYGIDCI